MRKGGRAFNIFRTYSSRKSSCYGSCYLCDRRYLLIPSHIRKQPESFCRILHRTSARGRDQNVSCHHHLHQKHYQKEVIPKTIKKEVKNNDDNTKEEKFNEVKEFGNLFFSNKAIFSFENRLVHINILNNREEIIEEVERFISEEENK